MRQRRSIARAKCTFESSPAVQVIGKLDRRRRHAEPSPQSFHHLLDPLDPVRAPLRALDVLRLVRTLDHDLVHHHDRRPSPPDRQRLGEGVVQPLRVRTGPCRREAGAGAALFGDGAVDAGGELGGASREGRKGCAGGGEGRVGRGRGKDRDGGDLRGAEEGKGPSCGGCGDGRADVPRATRSRGRGNRGRAGAGL